MNLSIEEEKRFNPKFILDQIFFYKKFLGLEHSNFDLCLEEWKEIYQYIFSSNE